MFTTDSFPGRLVFSEGKRYRYFGGTAYLGLAALPDFQEIFIRNIHKYGTGYAASRKANIRISIYEMAEAVMADLIGSEAVLSVSSGFLAGQLALQAFEGDVFTFFSTSDTHPALSHPRVITSGSVEKLIEEVNAFITSNPDKIAVVLCDAVTPENNLYENNWYEQLPVSQTVFIADDSHGLGVMGNHGEGIYKKLRKIPFRELVVCGSVSKGFGIQAGVVCSSGDVIRKLWDHPFFAGASPASPAAMATFTEALLLYDIQRKKLQNHMEIFDRSVSGSGISFNRIQGHPAYVHTLESLTRHLLDRGILITSFHYPDTSSPLVQRIVLSAAHTEEDISMLGKHILKFYGN
ncbi:aminotransferase class I/II-fold pyridoxal phosphate-dependent enzyme [Sinomicrobium sp. M5D2P17]